MESSVAGVTLIPSPTRTDRDAAAAPSPGPVAARDADGGIRPRPSRAAAATDATATEEAGEGPFRVDAARLLARCDAIRLRGRHRRH